MITWYYIAQFVHKSLEYIYDFITYLLCLSVATFPYTYWSHTVISLSAWVHQMHCFWGAYHLHWTRVYCIGAIASFFHLFIILFDCQIFLMFLCIHCICVGPGASVNSICCCFIFFWGFIIVLFKWLFHCLAYLHFYCLFDCTSFLSVCLLMKPKIHTFFVVVHLLIEPLIHIIVD